MNSRGSGNFLRVGQFEPDGDFVKFARLNGTLYAGGSVSAAIWDGDPLADSSDDVTVYDWWLPSGESLASGTKIAMTQISGKWYVVCA